MKRWLIMICSVLFLAAAGTPALAETLAPVNPVPALGSETPSAEGETGPQIQPFDQTGTLDRAEENERGGFEMVVGDTLYLVTPYTAYRTESGTGTYRSSFKKGQQVGIYVNDKGEIKEIWHLP